MRIIGFGLLMFFAVSLISLNQATAQAPFTKGVNLTNWFQASSPRQIQFTKYTKKDFENIKSLGADVVRLPINLHSMTSGEPDYTLDTLFLEFLDQAVDWCEELQIHLILDNHTFDPSANTDPAIKSTLLKVWPQMAKHYKDRSDYVLYEVLNEPHGIDNNVWAGIQQAVIDTIRTVDTKHFIVVGPANFNSYTLLSDLPVYTDTKLIYTFHFYDPFVFTHQGATWVDPSMETLAGVPFPYKASSMPATPTILKGTWVEDALNNYSVDGTVSKVKSLIDIAVNFKNSRSVPVYCGEFGVYIPNSNNADRVAWYQAVRQYFEEKNIPWTTWDYQGGFGLFTKNSDELFDYNVNTALVQALGMTVPPQKIFKPKPQTTGFLIYDDFIGEGVIDVSSPDGGTLDYYSTTTPEVGKRCIYWAGVPQYNPIALDFKPNLDLSLLVMNNHAIEFWTRSTNASAKFDVRFIDTKTGASDHPYRMNKTIDNSVIPWDGEWHKVSIKLSDFQDGGSYDNGWFPPPGNFDWTAVDMLQLVPEYGSLDGIEIWFDDIRDVGDDVPYEEPVTGTIPELNTSSLQVYPNPLTTEATIQFVLPESGPAEISVMSLTGQRVKTINKGILNAGNHVLHWDGTNDQGVDLAPAMYIIQLRYSDKVISVKIVR
ncbi:MAG TPA: cellulase family glycosylhydrolase [Cyclobacteriaceae bacterium]|nr:cellulase family glycosylhydrolase [Cyclobacteriaceae bacterium]